MAKKQEKKKPVKVKEKKEYEMPIISPEKRDQMEFASSKQAEVALGILAECRTTIYSLVGETEYDTIVNAHTMEFESGLVQRFAQRLEDIKTGILHGEN